MNDWDRQIEFLTSEAHALGYPDADSLFAASPSLFNSLAGMWAMLRAGWLF